MAADSVLSVAQFVQITLLAGSNQTPFSLTGERQMVADFAARFGISVLRDPTDPTAIEHNLRTAVIDASGRLVKVYSGSGWTPEELARDLEGVFPP